MVQHRPKSVCTWWSSTDQSQFAPFVTTKSVETTKSVLLVSDPRTTIPYSIDGVTKAGFQFTIPYSIDGVTKAGFQSFPTASTA